MRENKLNKLINGKNCIGTSFQLSVWTEIANISPGTTKTYQELANLIGRPNSARAVANACGSNPYPRLIPCHRVLRSDGSLGGYSGMGGIETKKQLLAKEIKNFK